jgi:hypothetical protein
VASDVQICNMALSHIGSDARVSSIDPPDGSVEAGHCATFYDQARTEMLEPGTWRFALKRATLASVTNGSPQWAYAYALPSDCLRPLRVLTPGQPITVFTQDQVQFSPNDRNGADFDTEEGVLYTNQPEATLLYVRDVVDSNTFPPTFVSAVSYQLAGYLAGPIVKGREGANTAEMMRRLAAGIGAAAAATDANGTTETQDFLPASVGVRR